MYSYVVLVVWRSLAQKNPLTFWVLRAQLENVNHTAHHTQSPPPRSLHTHIRVRAYAHAHGLRVYDKGETYLRVSIVDFVVLMILVPEVDTNEDEDEHDDHDDDDHKHATLLFWEVSWNKARLS